MLRQFRQSDAIAVLQAFEKWLQQPLLPIA